MPVNNPDLPRAVLWDLDGTLIDTAPVHWIVWREILAPEGIDLTWEGFMPFFGQRNDTALRKWLGPDLPDPEIARIGEAKERLFRARLPEHPPALLPGTARWLQGLRAAGWRQALATMTWRENIEAIFATLDLSEWFDAIITADDVTQGKPNPEVFLTAAARLGVPAARCVVVEDSPAGVEAARRAGMRCVGASQVHSLTADWVVRTLEELPADAFDRLLAGQS